MNLLNFQQISDSPLPIEWMIGCWRRTNEWSRENKRPPKDTAGRFRRSWITEGGTVSLQMGHFAPLDPVSQLNVDGSENKVEKTDARN